MSAEEVFISSSTKRIVPVSEINGKKIGNNSFRFSELIWKAFYELELGQG
jgi:branched-subunit amino acid aminotransferase/4-amino-4-deoxychorismate lyase